MSGWALLDPHVQEAVRLISLAAFITLVVVIWNWIETEIEKNGHHRPRR